MTLFHWYLLGAAVWASLFLGLTFVTRDDGDTEGAAWSARLLLALPIYPAILLLWVLRGFGACVRIVVLSALGKGLPK